MVGFFGASSSILTSLLACHGLAMLFFVLLFHWLFKTLLNVIPRLAMRLGKQFKRTIQPQETTIMDKQKHFSVKAAVVETVKIAVPHILADHAMVALPQL